LELGLKYTPYSHSFDGYYVGSNFAEDPKLTKEETNYVATSDNNCEVRKQQWYKLLDPRKGKVTATVAEQLLADSQLCAGALNAKVATAASVAKMQVWARMGLTNGRDYIPDASMKGNSITGKYAKSLMAQPWSLFPPMP
jgi:heat shock protein HspQ